jgi:hypothetical protein
MAKTRSFLAAAVVGAAVDGAGVAFFFVVVGFFLVAAPTGEASSPAVSAAAPSRPTRPNEERWCVSCREQTRASIADLYKVFNFRVSRSFNSVNQCEQFARRAPSRSDHGRLDGAHASWIVGASVLNAVAQDDFEELVVLGGFPPRQRYVQRQVEGPKAIKV